MGRLNPVKQSLWQSFGKASAGLARPGLRWLAWAGLGWATLSWARLGWASTGLPFKTGKRSGTAAPHKPKTDQKRSVTAAENGASESGKTKPLAELWQGLGWPGPAWPGLRWLAWAGLGWATLSWARLGWASTGLPFKTGKRSGTAAPHEPKTDQKRSVTAAENGASESGKTKPLAELWQGFGWPGPAWPGLRWLAWAGLGWATLSWARLGWASTGLPFKTGERRGTAAPNKPKTDQKRSVTAAENGASPKALFYRIQTPHFRPP